MPTPQSQEFFNLDESLCEGKSCLFESVNVYRFSKNFKEYTGFDHVGFDWSPCGHPPLAIFFSKPRLSMRIFRITPGQRESLECDMSLPFICDYPREDATVSDVQSTISGRN